MIDIEQIAREAGWLEWGNRNWHERDSDGIATPDLANFANLVLEAAAAKCASLLFTPPQGPSFAAKHQRNLCAAAIRAMKVTP